MTSIKIEVVKYHSMWDVRADVDFGVHGYEEIVRYRWSPGGGHAGSPRNTTRQSN
jgi:hypothetical protein